MKHAVMTMAGAALIFSIAHAASKADAEHAIAAAATKMKVAASLNDQWTPTVSALKAAKHAATKQDYATAEEMAKKAKALATASIEQAHAQKHLWQNEVPR